LLGGGFKVLEEREGTSRAIRQSVSKKGGSGFNHSGGQIGYAGGSA